MVQNTLLGVPAHSSFPLRKIYRFTDSIKQF